MLFPPPPSTLSDTAPKVYLQCISLSYFRKYLKKLHSSTVVTSTTTANAIDDKEEFGEKKELICGIKCRLKGKRRFFPLIVDEEHAERAYELLCEEIVRSDQLSDQEYESPLDLEEEECGMRSHGHEQPYRIKTYQSIQLPDFNCQIALRVISAVMNSMVVMFSTNAGEGKISDPALVGKMPRKFACLHDLDLIFLPLVFRIQSFSPHASVPQQETSSDDNRSE